MPDIVNCFIYLFNLMVFSFVTSLVFVCIYIFMPIYNVYNVIPHQITVFLYTLHLPTSRSYFSNLRNQN